MCSVEQGQSKAENPAIQRRAEPPPASGPMRSTGSAFWQLSQLDRRVHLRCLAPVAPGDVWVAGADGTVARTCDGGRTWQDRSPTGQQEDQFRAIAALTSQVAVVLSFGPAGRILRTADGGTTWRTVHRPGQRELFLNCLAFDAHGNGLALADPIDGRFRLLGSTDQGRSWEELRPPVMPLAEEDETSFAASGSALVAAGAGYRFVTGGSRFARVFGTARYGGAWVAARTPFPARKDAGLFSVAVDARGIGVAVGGDYHHQDEALGDVVSSADGGTTWRSAGAKLAYRSAVVRSDWGWIAAGNGCCDVSIDDGRTWQEIALQGSTALDALAPAQDGAVWGCGPDGVVGVLREVPWTSSHG